MLQLQFVKWRFKLDFSVFRPFLLAFHFFLLAVGNSFATNTASLQLLVASPNPITAGDKITFQVILVNNGSETWEKGQYYFEAQIYGPEKNYIVKTSKVEGDKDVPSGDTALAYLSYSVPENYSGNYLCRIYLTHKDLRIYEGEYQPFTVIPLAPVKQKTKKVTLGGNAILSARAFSTDERKDVLNLNINSVGQLYGQSMLFNLNSQTTRPDHTKVIQMLLTYYNPHATMNFGDVQPNFSPLSLAGSGARGLWVQTPIKNFSTELVAAQSVFKVPGSSTPAKTGTFARYVLGAKEKIELPKNFGLGIDYVKVFDDKNSLSTDPNSPEFRGPDPKEAKNEVVSGLINWKGFSDRLSAEGNLAFSNYEENTLSAITKTTTNQGNAYKLGINYKDPKASGKVSFQRTDTDFKSLAAPGTAADKQTIDLGAGYNQNLIKSVLGVLLNATRVTDNLKDDPKKNTSTQDTLLVNSILTNPKPWPGISLSYSVNLGQDKDKTALDNKTQTLGVNLNQSLGSKTNLSFGIQNSKFTDNLKKSADLNTLNQTVTLTSGLGSKVNVSLGGTFSKTDSEATAASVAGTLRSNSYSASINYNILKDKLTLQTWATLNARFGKSSGSNQDVQDQSQNVELTYQILKKLAMTLGWSRNKSEDLLTSSKNTDETIASGRLTITF